MHHTWTGGVERVAIYGPGFHREGKHISHGRHILTEQEEPRLCQCTHAPLRSRESWPSQLWLYFLEAPPANPQQHKKENSKKKENRRRTAKRGNPKANTQTDSNHRSEGYWWCSFRPRGCGRFIHGTQTTTRRFLSPWKKGERKKISSFLHEYYYRKEEEDLDRNIHRNEREAKKTPF